MLYQLSCEVIDLGWHLLNTRTGDLYEIDKDGRTILDDINSNHQDSNKKKVFDFMVSEGLLVCSEERSDREKFHLQWQLLNSCNLRCLHCYDWKEKVTTLTFEQMQSVVDNYIVFLKKMEMDGEISFTGGEPFSYPLLQELVAYTKSQDVFISVYILTNGTIPFSDQTINFLINHKIGIQISIDGTKEVHDKIRGTGNYLKSIDNIKRLLEAGIPLTVHYVIMKRNVEVIPIFIEEMEKIGIKRVNFSHLVPIGPGTNEEMLTPMENKAVIEMIADLQNQYRVKIISERPLWCLVGSVGSCPIGFRSITIDASGRFMPCRRLPLIIGDVRRESFFKVWFGSEFLQKMRQREKHLKVCGTCRYAELCGGCRAIAYALTGDAFAKDPSCWITPSDQYVLNPKKRR